jgi:hypothetical protein
MKSLLWAGILSLACIIGMILFNNLATKNDLTRDAYLSYASYAFDCLKVVFGMIIGALTEKFHTKKELEVYKETINNLRKPE